MVAFVVYSPILGNDFIVITDDDYNLAHRSWESIWTESYLRMFIPVTSSWWKILMMISDRAWLFHLVSIVLHMANTALVMKIAERYTKYWVVAGLIFALHPWQVETVSWVTCHRDLLGAFFGLAAFTFPGAVGWYILAILSKNSMLALGPILAAYLWVRDS